jgi:Fe-S cluster biogenesis protein NfuA
VDRVDEHVRRFEELIEATERLDEPARKHVFALLDAVDAVHRAGLVRLGEVLGDEALARARRDPAVAALLDAYGIGMDEVAAAEAALEEVRPYIHSHGGSVDVLAAEAGVVRVRMAGACAGCTASAVTLREGVERALHERLPSFVALEVEEDEAAPHPPPGPTLLQIGRLERP